LGKISTKQNLADLLHEYITLDLRLSYLIIAAMVLVGAVLNFTLPHGWAVWPFVLAASILTLINDAADRNGQGVPPFQVYAFFGGAVLLWIIVLAVLSTLNPLILLIGVAAVGYRFGQAYIHQRERNRLIRTRAEEGRCLHCGEIYEPNTLLCETCGEEPNPDQAMLQRVANIYRSPEIIARTRKVLTREAKNVSASAREAALIARHHGKGAAKTALPKAAKLGPSATSKRRN
jgi:hypothetical protein